MKIRIFRQNKMWRDKAIELMEQKGSKMNWRYLSDTEYDQQLRLKIAEEAFEIRDAASKDAIIAEIADVFEVVDAICTYHAITFEQIKIAQIKKREERGGFVSRKFIETAEHPVGSYGEAYCLADPEKYPEIV